MSSLPTGSRTRPARRRVLTATALTAAAALALSGCMKVESDITLSEEDTFSGTGVLAFSDEVAASMDMEPREFFEMMQEMPDSPTAELPELEIITEEPYADGTFTGVRTTYAEQSIGAFSDDLSITREGDEYVVQGVMELGAEATGSGDPSTDEFFSTAEFHLSVTFPGEITETTGEVEGTTVVWDPPVGETTEIYARGAAVAGAEETVAEPASDEDAAAIADDVEEVAVEEATGGFPWWAVGLVVGLAVLGTVAALVVRHNRRPGATATGAPGAGQDPHAAGPVPPDYGQPQQQASPVVPPRQDPSAPDGSTPR